MHLIRGESVNALASAQLMMGDTELPGPERRADIMAILLFRLELDVRRIAVVTDDSGEEALRRRVEALLPGLGEGAANELWMTTRDAVGPPHAAEFSGQRAQFHLAELVSLPTSPLMKRLGLSG